MVGEEDNGAAEPWDGREGWPPLPDEMCAFEVPWRVWKGVSIRDRFGFTVFAHDGTGF